MSEEGKAKAKEHIKQQYINRFSKLMEHKTQKEKEEVLIGEKYILKGHLAQAVEQVIEIHKRVDVTAKFSIVGNKLAHDSVICEEAMP
jgi:hypothetical protein